MDRHLFAKKRVSLAVSVALGAVAAAPVAAQESDSANSQIMEEVVVTGIRSSLKRAMDTKRDATGVVDAITAEDIGDFPDTNLAEALQRITGVSIDRDRGEGARVTVRGFGADFNLVTLNGRQMPTHSGYGRSFDFGDIASESVSGVEVYKTADASIPTGGIGATINVLTSKPLDNPGLTASLSAKGVKDQSSFSGEEWTPELAFIVSQTFLDDTVGISVTGSFQERQSGQASASNNEWKEYRGDVDVNGNFTPSLTGNNLMATPQNLGYSLDEWTRERINGQITLQWQPLENLTATLDYTYAELDLRHTANTISAWFASGSGSGVSTLIDESGVSSPLVYTETNSEPDLSMGAFLDASINERKSTGLNIIWDPTDRLSLELDYHDSSATRDPNSAFGSSAQVAMSIFGRELTSVNYTTELPVLTLGMAEPISPDDLQISGSVFGNAWADMNIEQTQFDGSFELTDTLTLNFGAAQTVVDNYSAGSNVQRNTWGQSATSAFGSVADLAVPVSLSGLYSELAGGDQVNQNFFVADMASLVTRAEYLQSLPSSNPMHLAQASTGGDCGTGFCPSSTPDSYDSFEEESIATYLQLKFMGELFNRPFNARLGARYEETEVDSYTEILDYAGVEWTGGNEFELVPTGDVIPSTFGGKYDFILPSLDMDIELTDDLVMRASFSQTVARAGYGSLTAGLSVPPTSLPRVIEGEPEELFANGGNPGVLPYEADNLDLSLEYYYGDASYISAGYFDKKVRNWISTQTIATNEILFPNAVSPGLGPLYQDAAAAILALEGGSYPANGTIRDYILANYADQPGVDQESGVITGVVGRDGAIPFTVRAAVNSDREESIDGWELAWQHNFWDTGLGFIANMTLADGSATYDNTNFESQFALGGLSDTLNFVAFYDKYGLQARIAYNWRDGYYSGGDVKPSYQTEYEQIDATVSYEFAGGLVAFVEGINITNETFRSHARSTYQTYGVGQIGARYNVGFRYKL
ncbi:TonB-dependent receptor [Luminiphilus sp.]|nr:TonB-dependent receptor [Luminiphilus sp.]MDB2692116.1 TonB-dependent receptor [Luminiphilus sp.]